MTRRSTRRRAVAALAVLAALSISALAGCSSDSDTDSGGSDSASETRTTTIDHAFGSTTVTGTPQRIVTLTAPATDAVLALGIQPVAYSGDTTGSPDARYPWEADLGTDVPFIPASLASVPTEEIAKYEPDLIVADYGALNKDIYDQLSAIAPTIPQLGKGDGSTYDGLTRAVGKIVDKEDEADAAIAAVDRKVSDLSDSLPNLKGKTALLAQYIPGTQQLVLVADPEDSASAFYQKLGMTLPPVDAPATQGRIVTSPERLDLLSSDLVIMLVNGGTKEQLEALPGYAQLPSVQKGGMFVTDYATVVALNTPSVLSIDYALGQVTPFLQSIAA